MSAVDSSLLGLSVGGESSLARLLIITASVMCGCERRKERRGCSVSAALSLSLSLESLSDAKK